ncbi:hypothetical protein [Fusibacter tunisiensis]|uniref:Uncharacterized protein n=1 Tax=Fusibacter tunisiensis TaxID=1008308 RepID=A0ABS2MS63_9FIRM|nr:hypothetical protein [Fusibacter tunisiensis]MBM7562269.1 hypothetical protein [Fusibacter tunisiensis]
MAIMSSRLIRHEICKEEFQKMGARVIDIQGIMFLVKFDLGGNRITYAYHLNEDNTFFVERIKPYLLSIGDFQYEEDIVDIIRVDVEQFRNAMNSSNFKQFIEIDNHLTKLVRLFEDLYLYYNISKEDLKVLDGSVDCVLESIKDIMRHSDRVYTKKDPEVLREDIEF